MNTDTQADLSPRYPCLKGKPVLITGGASGIGAGIVRAFHAQGALTSFLDIDSAAANALVRALASQGPAPTFVEADLRDIGAVERAVNHVIATHGPVRTLINNAARDDRHSLGRTGPDDWRQALAVNLDHLFFASQAVIPAMAAAGGGSIVNMSSNTALTGGLDMTPYITAKAGIIGLTRALAREVGQKKIRVNAVLPGWVMTPRQKEKWATPTDVAAVLHEQCIPVAMDPRHITGTILFLASEGAAMLTKQVIVVDGGRA